MKIVKLIPSNYSKFHIGDSNGQLKDHFSSDQLFSAIINNVDFMYDRNVVKKAIEHFNKENLIISSVFYGLKFCHKNEKTSKEIYFLPKPYWLIKNEHIENKDFSEKKRIRKIEFISLRTYLNLIESWDESNGHFTYDLINHPVIGGRFVIDEEEIAELDLKSEELNKVKIIDKYSMPKVSVNRLFGDSNNLYTEDITEIKYSNLKNYIVKPFMYFMYKGEATKEIRAAINMIQDEGIGGKRSSGLGIYNTVEFDANVDKTKEALSRYIDNAAKYYINVSTVFPEKEEVNSIKSYRLESRSGFIFSNGGQPYRKRSVRMIKEGSLFQSKINGMIKDITPNGFNKHKIWLYGKAFLIGFGGEKV